MSRLPYVDPGAVSPRTREVLERLPPLNIFRVMAHAESAFVPWLRLGGALLGELTLDPRLRELAILRVAALTPGADYEWVQHEEIARQVGVTADQIAAIKAGRVGEPAFDARTVLALEVTQDVVRDGVTSDERSAALAEALSPREILELLMVVGSYRMLGTVMAMWQIDLDPPAAAAVIAAAERRPPER